MERKKIAVYFNVRKSIDFIVIFSPCVTVFAPQRKTSLFPVCITNQSHDSVGSYHAC